MGMSQNTFQEAVSNMGPATLDNRNKLAQQVIDAPALMGDLIKMVFQIEQKSSIKAAWVLDCVCRKDLDLLLPQLDPFCIGISVLQNDSAIRPAAKICDLLAKNMNKPGENKVKAIIKSKHIESIVGSCFDWLIEDHAIAVRVFAMETLFEMGKNSPWIHDELKHLIVTKILEESPGTHARGKKILKQLQQKP